MKVVRSAFGNKGKLPPSRKAGHFLKLQEPEAVFPATDLDMLIVPCVQCSISVRGLWLILGSVQAFVRL